MLLHAAARCNPGSAAAAAAGWLRPSLQGASGRITVQLSTLASSEASAEWSDAGGPAVRRSYIVGTIAAHGVVPPALKLLGWPDGYEPTHPSEVAAAYTPRGGTHFVYCLMCKANGKLYIGRTSRAPEKRLKEHQYKPGRRLKRDVQRYRPFDEHFTLFVLADAESKAESELLEEFFIWKFCTVEYGYNILTSAFDWHPSRRL